MDFEPWQQEMAQEGFSVLLEFEGFKIPVHIPGGKEVPKDLLSVLEEKLSRRIGVTIKLALDFDRGDDVYLLQRYSKEWRDYIDVVDIIEIDDGDHLRAVPIPNRKNIKSPDSLGDSVGGSNSVGEAKNILGRVKKPSESQALALKKLFPAAKFNPKAECVAKAAHDKKKKFVAVPKAKKSSSVTVVMLKKYQTRVPRGDYRQHLIDNDCVKKVELNRLMSPTEVKNRILDLFKCDDFLVLECAKGGYLLKSGDDVLTSQQAIDRRGALYLCEKSTKNPPNSVDGESCSSETESSLDKKKSRKRAKFYDSDSDDDPMPKFSPKPKSSAAKLILQSRQLATVATTTLDLSDFEYDDPPNIGETSDEFQKYSVGSLKAPVLVSSSSEDDDAQKYLEESRRIRKEQDENYMESLRIDQLKALEKSKHKRLECLREQFKAKFNGDVREPSLSLPIMLPDSRRLSCKLSMSSPTKSLYEFVLANSELCVPFSIYTRAGHDRISPDSSLSALVQTGVLVVEEDVNGQDLLEFFSQQEEQIIKSSLDESTDGNALNESSRYDAENDRKKFWSNMICDEGSPHLIRRDEIYCDVMKLYQDFERIEKEHPFRIAFDDEEAIDSGGVARDMFSGFWIAAFERFFDGSGSLVPATHPNVDYSSLPILGTILSHGYLACGFLPVHISFPILAAVLMGPSVKIEDEVLCEHFITSLSSYSASILKEAFLQQSQFKFSPQMQSNIVSLLSTFDSRQIPSPSNLRNIVTTIAKHQFLVKPLGALCAMNNGVPAEHKSFWQKLDVKIFLQIYLKCCATAASVLKIIKEPQF